MGHVEGRVAICCERGLGQVLPAPLTTASYPSEFSETQLPRLPSLLAASQHRVGPQEHFGTAPAVPGWHTRKQCLSLLEGGWGEGRRGGKRTPGLGQLSLLGQGSAAGGQTEGRLVLHSPGGEGKGLKTLALTSPLEEDRGCMGTGPRELVGGGLVPLSLFPWRH